MSVMLFVLVLLASISGCATGSVVVTGEARKAIDPSQVKIYLDPPLEYETIGLVEASSAVEFSSQAAMDRAIEELKEQAASIGANGVLLLGTASQSGGGGGFYSGGVFYAYDTEEKVAKGRAILVLDEVRGEKDIAKPPIQREETRGGPRTSLDSASETSDLDEAPTRPRRTLESPSETPGR